MAATRTKRKHVVVVGAGGNIGSHLLPHLARMTEISKLTLVDPDSYDAANLGNQNITRQDVGRRKVSAQAAKLRQINPGLEISCRPLAVESVPLGLMRSHLILACLDSRRARMIVNRIALRLGVPWIDAGIEPSGWLARINLYLNSGGPCLECSWDEDDYRLLEQRYSCTDRGLSRFPSNAPSSLGALAGSLQALEVQRLISTKSIRKHVDRQVLLDARHQRHFITNVTPRSGCANSPHRPWVIKKLDLQRNSTLADLFNSTSGKQRVSKEPFSLFVAGQRFSKRVYCPGCGHSEENFRLLRANSPADLRCPQCRRDMWAVGRDLLHSLSTSSLSQRQLHRSLYSLGFRDSDVITLRSQATDRHYEIGAAD